MTPGLEETQKPSNPVKTYGTRFVEFNPADKNQKWFWDKEDNSLHSYGPYKDFVLIERKSKLVMINIE